MNTKNWISSKSLFTYFAVLLPVSALYLLHKLNLPFLNYSLNTNILILLVVSPLLEEFTFRGLLQDLILNKTKNYIFTVFLVNIAFVLLHYNINNNIVYLLAVFTCGIIFSVVKIYYGRIVYPIMLHVYYNLCFITYFKLFH
jgi:membrane protease YdiL (CAAX protease family)